MMGALPFTMLVVWLVPSPMKHEKLSFVEPRDIKYPGVAMFLVRMRSTLSLVGRTHPPNVQSPTQSSSAPAVPHVASVHVCNVEALAYEQLLAPSTKFVASRATLPVSARSQSVPHVVPAWLSNVAPVASSQLHQATQLPL